MSLPFEKALREHKVERYSRASVPPGSKEATEFLRSNSCKSLNEHYEKVAKWLFKLFMDSIKESRKFKSQMVNHVRTLNGNMNWIMLTALLKVAGIFSLWFSTTFNIENSNSI